MKRTALEPMYATLGTAVPAGDAWTFEPKYDGMRVLAFVDRREVRLVTRNGKDKTAQFPEIAAALARIGARRRHPLILDGEVVAIAETEAGSFQSLQSRMHLRDEAAVKALAEEAPAVFVAFDVLLSGGRSLLSQPWTRRRAELERVVSRAASGDRLRLSDTTTDSRTLLRRAEARGWEGVIAKRTESTYAPGTRSRDWLKLKLQHRAEFVVGGFTEPRNSRVHLGAVLLGYFDADGSLVYVGHTGGGFSRASLADMHRRLTKLSQPRSPFRNTPKTNERAHWVMPEVVVEVKFAEWTADGKLRQPIFLGIRDDKPARQVTREGESMQRKAKLR